MIALAKKQYDANELEKNKENFRKKWKVLRTSLPGKSFCSNILSNNFENNDPNNFKKFITNNVVSSIFIEAHHVNEVFNYINSLSLH